MMKKNIAQIYGLDCDEDIVALGPHEEPRTLCGHHFFVKLHTPFPESCEHSYYLDLDTWDVIDLEGIEDKLRLIKEENV